MAEGDRYWSVGKAEVYGGVGSSREGLTDAEARKRLSKYGKNEIEQKPPKTIVRMVWEHLSDVMVLVLLAAAGLSALLQEWTEAIVILAIVVVDMTIGVVQEKKAADAIAALRSMTAQKAKVLRQGEESEVLARDLVLGDVVMIEAGMVVPADMRLVESADLKIQEAALTGESVPVDKEADETVPEKSATGDRINMAYSSTIVMNGTGVGVVVATGMETEVGRIAHSLDNEDEMDSPMKRKLNRVGRVLSVAGLVVAVVIFSIGMLYGRPVVPLLLIAVSLAISVIPEGLPATATVVMALGVQRMAKQHALVRSLPAVETLGSATVICTDKTGTLTKNEMSVVELAVTVDIDEGVAAKVAEVAGSKKYRELVVAGALCNNATEDPDVPGKFLGDPTEAALITLAEKFGIDQIRFEKKHPRLFEEPFDSKRKRMTVINQMSEGAVAYTKGAADELLPVCAYIVDGDSERKMTEEDREKVLMTASEMSGRALRVLGFARKRITKVPKSDDVDMEHGLTFVGLTGMIDPPRKEVAKAVETCHEAGIRVVMITGDHKVTAVAIGRELGIYRRGDGVISGDELEKMSDRELDRVISEVTIFARVSPRDKLRIVKSLQRKKEVVAMTGDGVNDSPALKVADIGVAMGRTGTDVAKDTADLILLNDNFITIEHAIAEGRRVRMNIQKVIQFLLAGNVAEVLTLLVAIALNLDPPILAVHILVINLVTDTLPALALGVDPAERGVMRQKPVRGGSLFDKGLVGRVAVSGVVIFGATMAAYGIGLSRWGYSVAMTMAFAVLAISQLFHAYSQRSNTESVWARGKQTNKWLWVTVGVSAAVLAVILWVPLVRNFFRLVGMGWEQWVVVAICSVIPLLVVEVIKLFIRVGGKTNI